VSGIEITFATLGLIVAAVGAGVPAYLGLAKHQQERREAQDAGDRLLKVEEQLRALLGQQQVAPQRDERFEESALETALPQAAAVLDELRLTDGSREHAPNRIGRFSQIERDEEPQLLVRLVRENTFRVDEPFRYIDGDKEIGVDQGLLTDLSLDRGEADRLLLRALEATGVPLVRRYLIFASVTAATLWRSNAVRRLALVLWFLVMNVGVVLVVAGAVEGTWLLLASGLLLPLPASLLWGWRQALAGAVAAFFLPIVVVPSIVALMAYWVVSLTERVVALLDPITSRLKR
jgi:hypothetical protein